MDYNVYKNREGGYIIKTSSGSTYTSSLPVGHSRYNRDREMSKSITEDIKLSKKTKRKILR